MQTEKMRKENQQLIFLYILIQTILFIICFSIILSIDALKGYWPYAIAFGILILLFNIIYIRKRDQDNLYKETYRIRRVTFKIDLPQSFIIHVRLIMPDGKKAYYANNQIIPAIFVEFIDGNIAYLTKQMTDEQNFGSYKLIYAFKKKYALVEDNNKSRFIVHFDSLILD